MSKDQHYPPEHAKGQYHCPHCGVYAKQRWSHLRAQGDMYTERNQYGVQKRSNLTGASTTTLELPERWSVSFCEHCQKLAIWDDVHMIYPRAILVDGPNEDLDPDIQDDYLEAANILTDSPRATAAILRLALQKLCIQLGEKGKNINDDIGALVKRGLNPSIQKSLDALRITGNNAVHPGEIDLSEEPARVIKLFSLINFIAQKMITEPNEIDDFYDDLPETAKEQVDRRDGVAKQEDETN